LGGLIRVQVETNMGGGGVPLGSGAAEGAQARQTRDFTNDFNYRTRAQASWDVRQQTAYGTLRTYFNLGINVTTPGDGEAGNFSWDRAFIQFAGFTVGKTRSFFDLFTYGGGMSYHNVRIAGDTGAAGLTVWAYTAQFGNGVTGTLSAETPIGHNRAAVADVNIANFFGVNAAVVADTAFSSNPSNGFRLPDVVANLRVDQAWGFAGVSGAIHEAGGGYYGNLGAANNVNNGHPADKLGWAVAAGGNLNLPGGSNIGVNVCYAEGASGYCTNVGTGHQFYNASTSVAVGWLTDGVFANGTQVELTRVWSVQAAYQHIWSPQWRTSVFGGYVNVDYNDAATLLINGSLNAASRTACGGVAIAPGGVVAGTGNVAAIVAAAGNSCNPDFSFYEIGTRTQWNPVQQLDIGLSVLYTRYNTAYKGPGTYPANTSRPSVPLFDDQNVWSAMFRWQRNFYP
jgi:hypothetical protein